jgi:uncharacterized protein YggL (DUF469 family)
MKNDDDDAATVARMVTEIANRRPLELVLSGSAAIQLAGLLQLAQRHPKLDTNNRRTATMIVEQIRAYFADAPATLDAMRRGDDPANDRDWR